MGLDIGERRIGIAYANFLEMGSSIVVPAGFLLVENRDKALKELAEMAKEEGVSSVIAGVPLIQGHDNPQSLKIKEFLKELQLLLPEGVDLRLWDESLTSFVAGQQLVEAGLKHSRGSKKKGRVDSVAATIILQSFVDAHRGHLPPLGPLI